MVFPRNQDLGSLGEYLKISYSLEHCPSAVFSTSKYLEMQSGRNVGKKSPVHVCICIKILELQDFLVKLPY